MSKFRLFWFICFLWITIVFGFKCDFHEDGKQGEKKYHCAVKTIEKHMKQKDDNDVTNFDLEGQPTYISELEYPFCLRFRDLKKVSITGIRKIDENIFNNCERLGTVEITSAIIQELPENLFKSNTGLHNLIIKNTRLRTLPENIFRNVKYLWGVFLDNNQIVSLPPNFLKTHRYLDNLSLNNNKLKELNPTWFEEQTGLDNLYLNHNEITELPKNIFTKLDSLGDFQMSDNQLTVIHSDSFKVANRFRQMHNVNLDNNLIVAVDKNITKLVNARKLSMKGNICNNSSDEDEEVNEKDLSKCFANYKPREE